MLRNWIVSLLLALLSLGASAKEAEPVAKDVELEKKVQEIAVELRCLVCQNQTIADSHAELAVDLKNQVRDMLQKGMTKQQITDYMTQRYGDFVLYKPPVKATTALLWFGPVALFAVGGIVLFYNLARRRRVVADAQLSEEEHKRAQALLESGAEERSS